MTTDYDTPDLAEVIEEALESRLLDVHVALPGRVVTYDAAKQTAQIELGVHRVLQTEDGAPVSEKLPLLENVPVAFSRAAGAFLSFPLTAGDPGLVIFAEQSLDQWRSKGTPTPPGDRRRHSLTGGVFVPGLAPNALALSDPGIDSATALGTVGGIQLRMGASAAEVTTNGAASAADFVAMAAAVTAELDRIKTELDAVKADLTTIATAHDTHMHPTAPTGPASLPTVLAGAPGVSPANPGSVASTNLKADGP